MPDPIHEPSDLRDTPPPAPNADARRQASQIEKLTERQLSYLRLVRDNHSSKQIALLTGASYRAVDKQLLKANNLLGVTNRFDAARMLAEHDEGVESLPPADALPFKARLFPLPLPVPTAKAAVNTLSWKHVVIWMTIIAIAIPIGLTAAGMALMTLQLLLGLKTQ